MQSRKKGMSFSVSKKSKKEQPGKSRAVSFLGTDFSLEKGKEKAVKRKRSSKAKPISANYTTSIRTEEQLKR